jgi:hypothetical protein
MRMFFDPEDEGGFEAESEQLAALVAEWAAQRGRVVDPDDVAEALEYRHRGTVDGRLGLWRGRHVEEFLLHWLPRSRTELPGEPAADVPAALLALLEYIEAAGLADPRGDALPQLAAAVREAAGSFRSAMDDPARWGMAKFWATTAAREGVDLARPGAFERFVEQARQGRARYDADALEAVMRRQTGSDPLGRPRERAEPQLPIVLPGEEVLREVAAASPVVRRLAGLTAWAGREGRPLTKLGRLRVADARQLVAQLETGDQVASPRTSAELPRLNLLFHWARQARLVRVAKDRLYAVAKARPVVADPLALWHRAFEAVFDLRGPLVGRPEVGWSRPESMFFDAYEYVLPDVLNTLYSLPAAMPWPRLRDSVHLSYRAMFRLGAAADREQRLWLDDADADLRRVLHVLADLGALAVTTGRPDPVFFEHPLESEPGPALPDGVPAGLPPELLALLGASPDIPDPDAEEREQQLQAELDSDQVELLRLTDLGHRAVRMRLLAEGRSAPLVGELADAPAAGLLGVLAHEYDQDSARLELAAWTAAHGGPAPARDLLLDAIRSMPFRVRARAMLDIYAAAVPEHEAEPLLWSLRSDPGLAPTALSLLAERGVLAPADVTEPEAGLLLADGLLLLLDASGREGFVETARAQGVAEVREAIALAQASAHPDHEGLARLQALADGPLSRGASARRARVKRTGRRPSR